MEGRIDPMFLNHDRVRHTSLQEMQGEESNLRLMEFNTTRPFSVRMSGTLDLGSVE